MKRYFLLALLLGGCTDVNGKHIALLTGLLNPPTPIKSVPIYLVMGQSNALYMSQNVDLAKLLQAKVIVTAVPSSNMARWATSGDLYNNTLVEADKALSSDSNSYIAGVLFWQGETDAAWGDPDLSQWAGRFTGMVKGLRKEFGTNISVVFAQITDTHTPGRDQMRIIQANISLNNVVMVKTEGIVQLGDHTDPSGYAIMADRFLHGGIK
jgi:Carbohydrate esterase, sialic acid-specific acetylesterase